MDTIQQNDLPEQEDNQQNNTVKFQAKKKVKRKSEVELVEMMKDQYEDFKRVMESLNAQKMSRMDRMLDLYEQELNQNKKKT